MSRGFPKSRFGAREGFAKDGKWLNASFFERDGRSVFGYGKEKGSAQRVETLDKLREESQIKVPVFRGMGGFEVLDNKASAKEIKEYLKSLDKDDKKKNLYFGSVGDDLYHFTEDVDHASSFGSQYDNKGVVEGVLLSKSLLDISSVNPKPTMAYMKHIREPFFDDEKKDAWEKMTSEEKEVAYAEYEKTKNEYVEEYKNARKPIREYIQNAIGKPPYFLEMEEKRGKWGSSWKEYPKDEVGAKAMWIDGIVGEMAKQYEKKFGVPMPQDAHLPPNEKGALSGEMAESYNHLKSAIFYDKYVMKRDTPQAYLVLKVPAFKQLFKNAGFDAVAYRDTTTSSDEKGRVSFAVKDPNQFKAYAGDKKVNLKSNNMFDAD